MEILFDAREVEESPWISSRAEVAPSMDASKASAIWETSYPSMDICDNPKVAEELMFSIIFSKTVLS